MGWLLWFGLIVDFRILSALAEDAFDQSQREVGLGIWLLLWLLQVGCRDLDDI